MTALPRTSLASGAIVIGLALGLFPPSPPEIRGAEPKAATSKKVNLNKTEIDPADYRDLLDDLQGHILEDARRDQAVLIFVKFEADRAAVRPWIKAFASRYVTSASAQGLPGPFGGFFLSATGYERLGIPESQLPEDDDFVFGMKGSETQKKLGDPEPSQWEAPYRDRVDALILLADNDRSRLAGLSAEVQQSLGGIATILTTETIRNLKNEKGQEIEHFGFADSVSQPLFFKHQLANVPRSKFDPSAPLKLVLVPDPNGKYPYSHGSLLVVRKLRQDVARFREGVDQLARTLGIDPELAGAYVIGRFRDGTPVGQSSSSQGARPVPNDFNYADDPDGTRSPFHSHIHKMNPRGSSSDRFEKVHRIVRRSMMYGVGEDGRPRTDGEVGMIFMCFQANIHNQFAFQQKDWANTHAFPKAGSGPDPLIGQESRTGSATGQDYKVPGDEVAKYPKEWGNPEKQPYNLARCVTLRGGEYFFAPSLSFLRNLE